MELKDKRYQLTLGLHICPANTPFQFATNTYGKLTYEAMMQVQAVAAKYQDRLNEVMKPLNEELLELGVIQAAVVEGERNASAVVDEQPQKTVKKPGTIR